MTCGKDHYSQNIHENAHARFYVATNMAMLEYPYFVGRYDESSPTLAAKADEYILDSAIGDESVGNVDVLDRADDIGASIVVAADVMNDTSTTTERVVDMIERAEDRNKEYEVLIPLQFDPERETSHVDHYEDVSHALRRIGRSIDEYRLYVGGLINGIHPTEQIQRCIDLREHVGLDTYLHGLGVGTTREWVVTIRQCPWLMDSFDNSSIVQNLVKSGKLWTPHASWYDNMDMPRGTNSTVLSARQLEASLDLYNYLIGSDIREEDAVDEYRDTPTELVERVATHKQWYRNVNQNDAVSEIVNA